MRSSSAAAATVGDDHAYARSSSLHEEILEKEDRRHNHNNNNTLFSQMTGALTSLLLLSKGMIPSSKKGIMNEDGEYYEDPYNDQPWRCSFGTAEDDGIWMNRKDQAGTIMSLLVWLLISELQVVTQGMQLSKHKHTYY